MLQGWVGRRELRPGLGLAEFVDKELARTAISLDGIAAPVTGAKLDQTTLLERVVQGGKIEGFAAAQRLMGNDFFHGIARKFYGC